MKRWRRKNYMQLCMHEAMRCQWLFQWREAKKNVGIQISSEWEWDIRISKTKIIACTYKRFEFWDLGVWKYFEIRQFCRFHCCFAEKIHLYSNGNAAVSAINRYLLSVSISFEQWLLFFTGCSSQTTTLSLNWPAIGLCSARKERKKVGEKTEICKWYQKMKKENIRQT